MDLSIDHCQVCGKEECEELIAKNSYMGNKDTRWMCSTCFEEVHGRNEEIKERD